jgi:peptidoglycan/xylan/chitin deacetylase (PgdA/CDA1 family)
MKKRLTAALNHISRSIPLSLYQQLIHRDVVDFFWHAVSNEPMPHVSHLYPVVTQDDFESAIIYLKENFALISYPELHAYIFDGLPLPLNAIHISFDDGYAECFHHVRPLLLKHQIPCTFFLTTGLIDNKILFYRNKQSLCVDRLLDPSFRYQTSSFKNLDLVTQHLPSDRSEFITWVKDLRLPDENLIDDICLALDIDWQSFLHRTKPYLTTDQILQMHHEGFIIGAHTQTHRKLIDLSLDEIETEIVGSCQIIQKITNQEILPFSFPHSAWGLERDHLAEIRARHPKIGLLFDTKGLRRDANFIHNRVWAERPLSGQPGIGLGAGGIRKRLHLAYQETWVDETMAKARKLRR